jgi:glycosyltransferase involved in cell wall biosynthesis
VTLDAMTSPPLLGTRIALLCPRLDAGILGGIEREVVELANALTLRGARVRIVTSDWRPGGGAVGRPDALCEQVIVVRLCSRFQRGLWPFQRLPLLLIGLRRALQDHHCVIVFNAGWPLTLLLGGVFHHACPPLWYRTYWHPMRGLRILNALRNVMFAAVFKKADALLAPSGAEAQLLRDLCGPDTRVMVIEPGTEPPHPLALVGKDRIRKEMGLPSEAVLIAQVGRPCAFKGTHVALQAVAELRRRQTNAYLLIVGEAGDQPWLKDCIKANGSDDWTLVMGAIDDSLKSRVLAASDVALVLSEYEAFGFVALEALAHRLPIVLYDDFPSSGYLTDSGAVTVSRAFGECGVANAIERAMSCRDSLPIDFRTWSDFADDLTKELTAFMSEPTYPS